MRSSGATEFTRLLKLRYDRSASPVWEGQVHHGAHGDDAGRIDRAVTRVVVALDVAHVDGLGNAWPLIKFAQIA